MATFTFNPTTLTFARDWGDPTIWEGGVVPNAPTANVFFPVIESDGEPADFEVQILAGSEYSIASLTMNADFLDVAGDLSVGGFVQLNPGSEIDMDDGILSAASVTIAGSDIQGPGQIDVTGLLDVQTEIVGSGLSIQAGSLDNQGSLIASSGNLSLTVATGGFSNLVDGVLTGGVYEANSDVLSLAVGGVVTTDAASIVLSGGTIEFKDPTTGLFAPIEATLSTIAANGALTIGEGENYVSGPLTDFGSLILTAGGEISPTELTVEPGGTLSGSGTVAGSIDNEGTIEASYLNSLFPDVSEDLVIDGNISGPGHLVIGGTSYAYFGIHFAAGEIELDGATAQDVVFDGGVGTLQLDQPTSFTGTISVPFVLPPIPSRVSYTIPPTPASFALILEGVSYPSVVSYAYSGDSAGGTLTVVTSGATYQYSFQGDFQTSDFSLRAGPQALSTLPPSLEITVTPPYPPPTVAGTVANQNVSAEAADHPFARAAVASGEPDDLLNVTVTMSAAGNGSLAPSGGVPLSVSNVSYDASTGVYSFSGTAAAVTLALDTLVFTPNAGAIPPGQYQTTQFTVAVTDATAPNAPLASDSTTSVNAFAGVHVDGGAAGMLMIGTPGDDTITTTDPFAVVYGEGGLDTISLGPGRDTVFLNGPGEYGAWQPGQGLDVITGFLASSDRLAFDESVYGVTAGQYQFTSGPGATPTSTRPTFYYDTSYNYLWFDPDGTGPAAADLVAYLPGVSSLSASDLVPSEVSFAAGASVIDATPGTTVYGEGQDEILWATGAHETLHGGPYRETYVAEADHDTVVAGGGGLIAALGGDESLTSQTGDDTFYIGSPSLGVDTIYGFSEARHDSFAIQGSAFAAPPGFQFTDDVGFISGPGAQAAYQTATFEYDTKTGYLWYDPDGTGPSARTLVAYLPGAPTLRASDFSVV
jgi:hypothetical protein